MSHPDKSQRYGPLVFFGIAHPSLSFLAGLAAGSHPLGIAAVVCFFATFIATTLVSSAFSVLGEGPYLKRLIFGQLTGIAVVTAFLLGGAASDPSSMDRDFFAGALQFWFLGSLGTQLPLWLLRVFRGWQLHHEECERSTAFSVGDLLVAMVFASICLGLFKWNAELQISAQGGQDADYWIRLIAIPLAVSALVACLGGIPILALVFCVRDTESGCLIQFGIVSAVLFVMLLPMISIGTPTSLVLGIIGIVVGAVVFTSVPFVTARKNGFVLSSQKRVPNTKAEPSRQ